MRSTFAVVTLATDPNILTMDQMRLAAGLAADDPSQDAVLAELRKRVTADIVAACGVRWDGVHVATLRRETVRETFRTDGCDGVIFLARRFVADVVSISEAGTMLMPSDIDLDGEAGLIERISGHCTLHWRRGTIAVEYAAGFDAVPADLVGAAMDLVRIRLSSDSSDPLERGRTVTVEDIETLRIDRWVGSTPGSSSGPVPADIASRLSRYMNIGVA